jgi:alpha-glucosidase
VEYPVSEYRSAWQLGGQPIVERLHDKGHTWQQLRLLVPDMLAAGILGHSFICPDMAGGGSWAAFLPGAPVDEELLIRSIQIHALCGMMQLSVSPWRILTTERRRQIVRDTVALRQRFAGYFVETAKASAKSGEPMIRYLDYAYPGLGYEKITDQFLLGEKLLVAPVQEKGRTSRKAVIPPGAWRGDDGVVVKGPAVIDVASPLERVPHWTLVSPGEGE